LELVVWLLAGSLVIRSAWKWSMRHADHEHRRHVEGGDARAVHELEHREGR
jgi:hypothetical protein